MAEKRLLLVEDDYDVAEMLIMYFQSHNYEVLHADTGLHGIELARTRFPNLILLDVMLPYMDGYDVCVQLRNTALTKYIPILFLTQRDERASKVRGLELGADDYITKPFDIDELRLRVQGSINRATRENLHEARTGLPTGQMVDEELSRVQNKADVSILTYTIVGFNVFNDVYGFMAGSDVLKHAGSIIQSVLGDSSSDEDFVGIVNDEFLVIAHTTDHAEIDGKIKKRFAEEVRAFYSFMDVDQGGITINEGEENEKIVPVMTLDSHEGAPVTTSTS